MQCCFRLWAAAECIQGLVFICRLLKYVFCVQWLAKDTGMLTANKCVQNVVF